MLPFYSGSHNFANVDYWAFHTDCLAINNGAYPVAYLIDWLTYFSVSQTKEISVI